MSLHGAGVHGTCSNTKQHQQGHASRTMIIPGIPAQSQAIDEQARSVTSITCHLHNCKSMTWCAGKIHRKHILLGAAVSRVAAVIVEGTRFAFVYYATEPGQAYGQQKVKTHPHPPPPPHLIWSMLHCSQGGSSGGGLSCNCHRCAHALGAAFKLSVATRQINQTDPDESNPLLAWLTHHTPEPLMSFKISVAASPSGHPACKECTVLAKPVRGWQDQNKLPQLEGRLRMHLIFNPVAHDCCHCIKCVMFIA